MLKELVDHFSIIIENHGEVEEVPDTWKWLTLHFRWNRWEGGPRSTQTSYVSPRKDHGEHPCGMHVPACAG